MLSNRYKVILDNGFKLELIRECRDYPLRIGAVVELKETEEAQTAREVFESVVSDKMKDAIVAEVKEAVEEKISNK